MILCFYILTEFFNPGWSPGWFITADKNNPIYTWQSKIDKDGDEHVDYLFIGNKTPGNKRLWDKKGSCKLNNKVYPVYKRYMFKKGS